MQQSNEKLPFCFSSSCGLCGNCVKNPPNKHIQYILPNDLFKIFTGETAPKPPLSPWEKYQEMIKTTNES